eukprot:GGOE01005591.1.p1 GENE.GGOE01005591.1~~GGOE01005591.1.p1  ORF type:complete len:481 (-),score=141.22 GGOE01005591.1:193-1608(-)
MEALKSELSRLLSGDPLADALGREPSTHLLERDFSSEWSAEKIALQEIYGDDFQFFNGRDNVFRIQILNGERCTKQQLWLYFVVPMDYPARPCIVEVEPNFLLSRKQTDMMYALLADELLQRIGMPMIFDICNAAVSLLETLKHGDGPALAMLASRNLAEGECCSMFVHMDFWVDPDTPPSQNSKGTPDYQMRLFTAQQFTGPVADILARMPASIEVLHIESVMRRDLAVRFDLQQLAFFQKYSSEKRGTRLDASREVLSAITVAFHGTPAHNMQNIVREGLVVPRLETGVEVACGSRYGQGIYLSPNADFSLHYCRGGGKLLVCAVLLGKQWICGGCEYMTTTCTRGFDSHVSPCGNELILFNEAQVLPCFVIHYCERSAAQVTQLKQECVQNQIVAAELSGSDRKKRLTSLARKHLPFGFGPAGDRFEVLEVAPVDEDDEEYGLYQAIVRENEFQDNVVEERKLKEIVG